MSYKKVEVNLPDNLVDEIDVLARREDLDRGELMRQAVYAYISEKKRWYMREQMKKGYLEMASINLELATEQAKLEAEADEYLPAAEGS
ncbi:CopG family transcriptional regulator/antitoxin EndoAI [Desulfohalotomaculum tongense]|uniref:ribbon-helix-helix protein, CopG family n=1 Tax=Desulforadius tongensis TaxID=1216062 RepID=UPI00195613BB|nr:CopG family transcriptional regulator/antitoxin EndoAI [Desulforadius tongensis]